MSLINKKQEYQDREDWSNDVQKLKGYKEFAEKVEHWDKQENSYSDPVIDGSYEIVYDNELGWCVDVAGGVSFYGWDIEEIPFQFRNVIGYFNCSSCACLTSLKGCPIYVGKDFSCSECFKLTSLEGCPKEVYLDFCCNWCLELTSLEGCPEEINGWFECNHCTKLTSLEGCPKKVGGSFRCFDCCPQFTKEYVQSLCNVKKDIIYNW